MEPVLHVLLAWLVFAGTHIWMASAAVRAPLVARLGPAGFGLAFSLVATITFSTLCFVYSGAMGEGPAGLALGATWLRWPLMTLSVLGIVCATGALLDYPTSAYLLSTPGRKPEPRGFERITRHGFAVGLSIVGVAHALLATRMTGGLFFACLAVFGIAGSMHQDAKLLARNPSLHGAFLEKSSMVPFAAILTGRNRLVLSEVRPLAIAIGLVSAWGLREAHPSIFADGGVYVIAATIGGAVLASIVDAVTAMRRARHRTDEARPAVSH